MQIARNTLSNSLKHSSPPSRQARQQAGPQTSDSLDLGKAQAQESGLGFGKILGGVAMLGLALGVAGCTPGGGAEVQQEATSSQKDWTPSDVDLGVDRHHSTGVSSDGTVTSRIGNTTVDTNGKVSTRVGNSTVIDSDGRVSTEIGNTVIRSDGTFGTRVGNSVINSDGTISTRIGNTVINSDGTIGFQF